MQKDTLIQKIFKLLLVGIFGVCVLIALLPAIVALTALYFYEEV